MFSVTLGGVIMNMDLHGKNLIILSQSPVLKSTSGRLGKC